MVRASRCCQCWLKHQRRRRRSARWLRLALARTALAGPGVDAPAVNSSESKYGPADHEHVHPRSPKPRGRRQLRKLCSIQPA